MGEARQGNRCIARVNKNVWLRVIVLADLRGSLRELCLRGGGEGALWGGPRPEGDPELLGAPKKLFGLS